jgi:hypothetical protein
MSPHRTHYQYPHIKHSHIDDERKQHNHSIDIVDDIKIAEIKAHEREVKETSKKNIACLVATSAIAASLITAGVTLTIHFTTCNP